LKADALKLVAYGKVLDNDEKKISEYGIKESDFIVAMVQKAKPQKQAAKPKPAEEKKEENPAAKEEPPVQPKPPAFNPPVMS